MPKLRYYLLLDHILIQGANAVSSPLTYGFPSVSGFVGAIHALSRKIKADPDEEILLDGVMIACHDCDVQVYQPTSYSDYTFKLTRNPIGKDGKTRSIIEEGKVHLDVSLVVEIKCSRDALDDDTKKQLFLDQIKQQLLLQRIAGGSVLSIEDVILYPAFDSFEPIIRQLLPAFVLINAEQELADITQELQQKDPTASMLDALIETAMLHHNPTDQEEWQTDSVKTGRGWLVPIHVGYQAISPLFLAGKVAQTRSDQYATQFVECVYGLGKWVFPYNLNDDFNQRFWRYQAPVLQSNDADIYLINQQTTDY